ncbi:MAG: hypothetical protein AAGJ82_08585 [Bacteroidota bacterium]
MKNFTVVFYAIVLFVLSACEQAELSPVPLTEERVDIFLTEKLRSPGENDFTDFLIELDEAGEDGYLFWQGGVTQRPFNREPFDTFYTTLIMGAHLSGDGDQFELYGFQFWPTAATPDEVMSKASVEGFFAPGNRFSFGEGEGKVDVSLRLPIGGPYGELRPSKSSYLAAPEGELTITAMEDYTFTEKIGVTARTVTGKLVHYTLAGQLGYYDLSADTADGMPWFETNEIVEITAAEGVFFVAFE